MNSTHRYLCLALAAGLASPGVVSARPENHGTDWVRSHPFTVSALVQPEWLVGPWNTSHYRACHMNTVHAWHENTDLGRRVNQSGLTLHFALTAASLDQRVIQQVNALSSSASSNGWYLYDEPHAGLIPGIAAVAQWLKGVRPNSLVYLNVVDYGDAYLESIMTSVRPDVLMYDQYPYIADGVIPGQHTFLDGHFVALSAIRSKTLAHGVPFFGWIQAFAWGPPGGLWRAPSESEIRMQTFGLLAAGCKGISHFLWDQVSFDLSLIDPGGTPTALYYAVQSMNPEIANLGPALRYLESTDIRYVPGRRQVLWWTAENPVPAGILKWSPGAGGIPYITSISVDQLGEGRDGFIGFYRDDPGRLYFMLVNQYCGPTRSAADAVLSFRVQFHESVHSVTRLNRLTGTSDLIPLNNNMLSVTLPGGTGDLFCMDQSGFDLAPPSGSIRINSGARFANDTSVVLEISATDDRGVEQMRFSNDRLGWSVWQGFAGDSGWTLIPGTGIRRVYAQFQDAVGTVSEAAVDDIFLDTSPPAGAVDINSGAATATSPFVSLTLAASDTGSGVGDVRLSNDGVTWSGWSTFESYLPWALPFGDGLRAVHVQFRDVAGNESAVCSATIRVDTSEIPEVSVAQAKAAGAGWFGATRGVLTAVFADTDWLYVQDPDRACAVRLCTDQAPDASAGDEVRVTGAARGDGSLQLSTLQVLARRQRPTPLGASTRTLSTASGVDCSDLLMRTWGRVLGAGVTDVWGWTRFVVSDGSTAHPDTALEVLVPPSVLCPEGVLNGAYVAVTGIAVRSCGGRSSLIVRETADLSVLD